MVNTGKPSGACVTCKNRRIKCDEARPNCLRCQSSNRKCLGYPQKESFEIKDQTNLVKDKLEKKQKKTCERKERDLYQPREESPSSSQSPCPCDYSSEMKEEQFLSDEDFWTEVPLRKVPTLTKPVNISIDDTAVCYFFDHYVPPPRKGNSPRLFLANLANLYSRAPIFSPLFCATNALALTVLAHFAGLPWVHQKALSSYGESLHVLSDAISDKESAKDDGVITASLLICLFEVSIIDQVIRRKLKRIGLSPDLKCKLAKIHKAQTESAFSVKTYQSHLRGLSMLIRNRGKTQFQNPCSLALFRAVRHQSVLQAIRRSESLDPFWTNDRDSTTGNYLEAPGTHLDRVAIHIPPLQVQIHAFRSDIPNTKKINCVLQEGYALDGKLVECYRDLLKFSFPQDFRHADLANPEEIPASPINPKTPNYLVHAGYYNNFRMYRIYIQAIIVRCLALLLSPQQLIYDERFKNAMDICQNSANEICRNADVFFNSEITRIVPQAEKEELLNRHCLADYALGAYCHIWPMFVTLGLETIPAEQRDWIQEKMELATERFGFQHAKVLRLVKPYLLFG